MEESVRLSFHLERCWNKKTSGDLGNRLARRSVGKDMGRKIPKERHETRWESVPSWDETGESDSKIIELGRCPVLEHDMTIFQFSREIERDETMTNCSVVLRNTPKPRFLHYYMIRERMGYYDHLENGEGNSDS